MHKVSAIFVVVLLFVALLCGGFVHAVVPHEEGDHHASSGIVWGSLHSVLSHEDRFFALTAAYLFVFTMLLVGMRTIVVYAPIGVEAKDQKKEALRRGIAKYRRFD